ncbi:hypothetical protein C0992_001736 [Termitomyces sp. T32_za158]|nr:hypothetical protein C0992_001736 [Termitomyces sp. T32_za158]
MDTNHLLPPPHKLHLRRRSADVGGLHLAMENTGHGQGWVGDSGDVLSTKFAELLVDMYTSTLHAVNEQGSDFIPVELPPSTRSRLIKSMETWEFEPHKLTEEELLACTFILFEVLYRIEGLEEAIGVSMKQITPFVYHLRRIYRLENSYHNFEHALDVLQAVYSYLRAADMVPPLSILHEPGRKWVCSNKSDCGTLITSLGLHDLFVLYVAAIGHDVGHPGFTNTFMKNASTPLSEVYDGKSALEQMHSQLLLRVMRYHGLGVVLDHPTTGLRTRRLLWETILATDMSVHDLFMKNLSGLINGQAASLFFRQSITCQTLMKCADISNPSRPYHVAKHWASALMEEWSSQALYEKFLDLPTTVQSNDSPINEANAQVFFIDKFAKPLLDLTIQAIPDAGLRPRIDANQVPSPIELVEEDRLKWEGQVYMTLPGKYAPASTSDFTAIDQGSASPKFARVTTWRFPSSSRLASECAIPLAAVFQPFAELDPAEEPVPLVHPGESGPARCERCLPVTQQRPELMKGTVDFVVPEEYWAINPPQSLTRPYFTHQPPKTGSRPPEPMKYIFAFDVSYEAVQLGFLRSACACISRILFGGTDADGASIDACFPPECSVAFLTYDSTIHFYDLSTDPVKMLVVSDIEEVFVPLQHGLFVNPIQRREVLESFLETLPTRFQDSSFPEAALGSLLRCCHAALVSNNAQLPVAFSISRTKAGHGGQVFVFSGTIPTVGIGQLKGQPNETDLLDTDKERGLYQPRDNVWIEIGQDCAADGIGVHMVLAPIKYMDVGSIGRIALYRAC